MGRLRIPSVCDVNIQYVMPRIHAYALCLYYMTSDALALTPLPSEPERFSPQNQAGREAVTFELRLQREITNWRCISHPNIVKLLDYFSVQPLGGRPPQTQLDKIAYAGSSLYLTMELCPGRDLFDALKCENPPTPEMLTVALSKVGRALQYLHATNIVHRDVKPENIGYFCDESKLPDLNTAITCKLFAFGLSKQLGKSPSQMGLTRGAGTPQYRAPEINKESSVHGLKADVFSFGLTIAGR